MLVCASKKLYLIFLQIGFWENYRKSLYMEITWRKSHEAVLLRKKGEQSALEKMFIYLLRRCGWRGTGWIG